MNDYNTETRLMVIGNYSAADLGQLAAEAEKHQLKIVAFDCWEKAQIALERDFLTWQSIILDVWGKMESDDESANFFLRNVLDELESMFYKKSNEIPWFVLPSNDSPETDKIVSYAIGSMRYKKNWGPVLFKKADGLEHLMQNIAGILPNIPNYRLRIIYDEVFEILENHFPLHTKNLLFNVLQPLHFPEKFHTFDPTETYDNLRRTIESFLSVCCTYGIIPREVCYSHEGNGDVNLAGSVDYLQESSNLCPSSISDALDNILKKSNAGCHMGDDRRIEGYHYTVMAFALELCDAIVWLGRYIKEKDLRPIDDLIQKYIGQNLPVHKDDEGNYYCNECCFPNNSFMDKAFANKEHVHLEEVFINTTKSRKKYPLRARVTRVY